MTLLETSLRFIPPLLNLHWSIYRVEIRETVETVSDFILGGSQITADGDAAMKLKDVYSLEGKLQLT